MKTQPHDPARPAPEGSHALKGLTKREYFALAIQVALIERGSGVREAAIAGAIGADALILALNQS